MRAFTCLRISTTRAPQGLDEVISQQSSYQAFVDRQYGGGRVPDLIVPDPDAHMGSSSNFGSLGLLHPSRVAQSLTAMFFLGSIVLASTVIGSIESGLSSGIPSSHSGTSEIYPLVQERKPRSTIERLESPAGMLIRLTIFRKSAPWLPHPPGAAGTAAEGLSALYLVGSRPFAASGPRTSGTAPVRRRRVPYHPLGFSFHPGTLRRNPSSGHRVDDTWPLRSALPSCPPRGQSTRPQGKPTSLSCPY